MKIVSTFFLVLANLGAGSAVFASWLDARNIRKSYFEFCAGLSAVMFLGVALWQAPQLSFYALACLLGAGAYWSFHREHPVRGRLFLKSAGLVGLTLALFSLADDQGLLRGIPPRLSWIFLAQLAAGGMLLGAVHATMLLGHWYLIMTGLDFSHLRRAVRLFCILLGVRAACVAGGLLLIRLLDPLYAHRFIGALFSPSQDLFFFAMRVFWGLLMPAGLAWMTWRCAKSGSNQAATGLLYLTEVSVLIGETLAVYLRT
jgi:hypothetical protein